MASSSSPPKERDSAVGVSVAGLVSGPGLMSPSPSGGGLLAPTAGGGAPQLARDASGADDMSTEEPPQEFTVGEFILGRRIGKGSFGKIYEGHHIVNVSQRVAIKLEPEDVLKSHLKDEHLCYKQLVGGFGIPRTYFCGRVGDFNCLVMDLLGPSLERHRGRFSMDQVVIIADQCISRMQFLHKHGLVYNDVKPANFLLGLGEHAETVFVVDFGLARFLPDDLKPNSKDKDKLKLARVVPFEEKQQRDKIKEERLELEKQFGSFLSRATTGSGSGPGASSDSKDSSDDDFGGGGGALNKQEKLPEDDSQIPLTRQNETLSRDDAAPGLGVVRRQKELLFAPSLASLREAGLLEEEDTMSNLPAPDTGSEQPSSMSFAAQQALLGEREREALLLGGSKSVAALHLMSDHPPAPGMAGLHSAASASALPGVAPAFVHSHSAQQPPTLQHNNNTSMPVLSAHDKALHLERSAGGAHLAPSHGSSVQQAQAPRGKGVSSITGQSAVGTTQRGGKSIFFWRNKAKTIDKKKDMSHQYDSVQAGTGDNPTNSKMSSFRKLWQSNPRNDNLNIPPRLTPGATQPHAPVKAQSAAAVFGAPPPRINHSDAGVFHVVGAMPESKTKEAPRKPRGLIGTPRFASVNAHMGVDLMPRDDMESLGFMLVYLAKGKLPWQGIRCQSRQEMYDRILAQKVSMALPELCKDLPAEFIKYFSYLRLLTSAETIDYDYLRLLFSRTKARLAEERQQQSDKEREAASSATASAVSLSPATNKRFLARFFSKDGEQERELVANNANRGTLASAHDPAFDAIAMIGLGGEKAAVQASPRVSSAVGSKRGSRSVSPSPAGPPLLQASSSGASQGHAKEGNQPTSEVLHISVSAAEPSSSGSPSPASAVSRNSQAQQAPTKPVSSSSRPATPSSSSSGGSGSAPRPASPPSPASTATPAALALLSTPTTGPETDSHSHLTSPSALPSVSE